MGIGTELDSQCRTLKFHLLPNLHTYEHADLQDWEVSLAYGKYCLIT